MHEIDGLRRERKKEMLFPTYEPKLKISAHSSGGSAAAAPEGAASVVLLLCRGPITTAAAADVMICDQLSPQNQPPIKLFWRPQTLR
jgi:hypothetical protein